MSIEVSTLANGLRVVTHRLAHLETVSLGVWVGCGARSESADESGLSHFLEHMAFKGTKRRSARRIAEEIEAVGGDLNAATSLETTAYYARVLKGDVGLALEILGDILQNSTFDAAEMARERDVILQEIAATKDSPDDVVHDGAQAAAFPDQATGRPILGTARTVRALDRSALVGHLERHYGAANMVMSAAGALDHDQIVRHAEAQFAVLNRGCGSKVEAAHYGGGRSLASGPFEQTHVILGFEGPTYRDGEYYGAQVLSGLFGGGMSSRLFQEARERRGLCYSIYSYCWGMADSGFFGIHAATGDELVGELGDVIVDQLEDLASHGPSQAELDRAKAQIRVGLAMSLESSGTRAEQMARQLQAFGRLKPMEELLAKVADVSRDDIRHQAGQFMRAPSPTWAEVSTNGRSPGHERILARFGAL